MNDESKNGSISCGQAREHLSDLLDIRRGETPPPGATPLADPIFRATVETHVTGCADCRSELRGMSEIGLAYAEFNVGERPAQDFDGYATAVRARINGGGKVLSMPGRATVRARDPRGSGWRGLLGVAITSAAAAVLAVTLFPRFTSGGHKRVRNPEPAVAKIDEPTESKWSNAQAVAFPDAPKFPDPVLADNLVFGMKAKSGGNQTVQLGKNSPDTLKYLNQTVEREGMVLFIEHPRDGEAQSLGAALAVSTEEKANPEGCQKGLAVLDVMSGSPAYAAGLRKGMYILGINGVSFEKSTLPEALKYLNALQQFQKGEVIQVDYAQFNGDDWVIRRGETHVGVFDR